MIDNELGKNDKTRVFFERPNFIMANRKLPKKKKKKKSGEQESGHWFRTGSCWCRKVVAGSGMLVAAAVRWSPVQEGSCWCRLKEY